MHVFVEPLAVVAGITGIRLVYEIQTADIAQRIIVGFELNVSTSVSPFCFEIAVALQQAILIVVGRYLHFLGRERIVAQRSTGAYHAGSFIGKAERKFYLFFIQGHLKIFQLGLFKHEVYGAGIL